MNFGDLRFEHSRSQMIAEKLFEAIHGILSQATLMIA